MKTALVSDVCDIRPATSVATAGDTPVFVITTACLTESGFSPAGIKPARMWARDLANARVEPGEVLIARSNTPELVGRVSMYQGEPHGVVASDLTIRLRARPGLLPEYLAAYLSYLYKTGFWIERAGGASGSMKKIRREQLLSLEVPVPTEADQRRVSRSLERATVEIASARTAAAARLAAANTLCSTYLREGFRGIVPLTAEAVPPSPPPGWTWRTLTKLARLESGHTPSRYHPEWWGGEIPWIALPDIRALDGQIAHRTSENTNPAGIANSAARVLPARTVVLSRTASVGFVTIMGRPMATSQDFANWVCGPEIVPEFLLYLLMSARDYVRSLASGAVHKTVYMPTLAAFQVCIPPTTEQQLVARQLQHRLQLVRQLIDTIKAEHQSINRLSSAVLREAFSGE